MLSFVDVAMAAYVKSRLLRFPVIIAPPESSMKVLSDYMGRKLQKPSTGVPGLTIFRTATPLNENHPSNSQADIGWPAGQRADGNYIQGRTIPVLAEYTCVAWANTQIEMNDIERELSFLTIYNACNFELTVKNIDNPSGPLLKLPIKFPVFSGPGTYSRELHEKNGMVRFYSLTKSFAIDTYWLDVEIDPQVREIDVSFIVESGNDVGDYTEVKIVTPPNNVSNG